MLCSVGTIDDRLRRTISFTSDGLPSTTRPQKCILTRHHLSSFITSHLRKAQLSSLVRGCLRSSEEGCSARPP